MKVALGVDIGGTHITSCGVDLQTGNLIFGSRFENEVDSRASKEEIFRAWANPINNSLAILDKTVKGVGFGMPGSFNYKEGIALFSGNAKYEALYNVSIKEEFMTYLNHEKLEFRFMNDASAFAVGSAWFGKAKKYERVLCLTLGTGFGSCFIRNEVPQVRSSNVPEHGCLWHLPFEQGIADDYFSTRWFVSNFEQKTGVQVRGVKEIVDSEHQQVVKSLFDEFGTNMATFLLPWLRSFKPDVIIIGGNISKAWHQISPSFCAVLNQNEVSVNINISKLMVDAAISGSARLVDDQFWGLIEPDLPEK